MTAPLKEFFEALTEQERKFIPTFADDRLGILLRTAINELDWYAYNLARAPDPTDDQNEQFYILRMGLSRAIKLALEARPSFDVPVVLFRRTRHHTIPALEICSALGMIEHGRRVGQTTMSGVGTIQRVGDREFVVTLPSAIHDDEYYERAVADHYLSASRTAFNGLLASDPGKKLGEEVSRLLTELVYPFERHYIGYGAHPVLDTYFFGIAFHQLQLAQGYDTFHYAIRFGGISFQKYKLALAFLISLAIRHERFAEALVIKEPEIRLEDILTITSDTDGFIESMCEAINYFGEPLEGFEEATVSETRTLFSVLSVGRDSTTLLDRPGCPLPPLIRCSEAGFIRCQTAAHSDPMHFLLDALRHHFPKEYDAHQRTREGAMQAAVKRVLDDAIDGLEYRPNIKIRVAGKLLTDIDLVVAEASTGAVLLIQLKHQDLYGTDIHSRNIRTDRLKEQTGRWLDSTKAWVDAVDAAEVRSVLRLPHAFPDPELHRIIVTRHYSYPIQDIRRDDDVAFANWNQFFNAVELAKESEETPRLASVVRILKENAARSVKQEHLPEPPSEWIIDDLRFTIRQRM